MGAFPTLRRYDGMTVGVLFEQLFERLACGRVVERASFHKEAARHSLRYDVTKLSCRPVAVEKRTLDFLVSVAGDVFLKCASGEDFSFAVLKTVGGPSDEVVLVVVLDDLETDTRYVVVEGVRGKGRAGDEFTNAPEALLDGISDALHEILLLGLAGLIGTSPLSFDSFCHFLDKISGYGIPNSTQIKLLVTVVVVIAKGDFGSDLVTFYHLDWFLHVIIEDHRGLLTTYGEGELFLLSLHPAVPLDCVGLLELRNRCGHRHFRTALFLNAVSIFGNDVSLRQRDWGLDASNRWICFR